jgi:hypothetical protein
MTLKGVRKPSFALHSLCLHQAAKTIENTKHDSFIFIRKLSRDPFVSLACHVPCFRPMFEYRHLKKEYEGCDTITFKVLGISVLAFVLSSAKSPCLLYNS